MQEILLNHNQFKEYYPVFSGRMKKTIQLLKQLNEKKLKTPTIRIGEFIW